MPSIRQLEANRRNAQKSTGPTSAEGKARVSRNALKHGLAGHGVVLTDEMTAVVEERMKDWYPDYRPDSPAERWRFVRICIESVRLDQCVHQAIALRDELAKRAAETWDDDQAFEAERLGARLPLRPELVQPQLLGSRHGVLWLIDRWQDLGDAIARQGGPTEADWSRLLDLLGVPIDGRIDAPRRLIGDQPEDGSLSDLIRIELDRLRGRLDSHLDDRDDRARIDAQAGLSEDAPAVLRISRYEQQIHRRLRQAEADLRRLQAGPPPLADRPRSPADPAGDPPAAPRPSRAVPASSPARLPNPPANGPSSPPTSPLNRRARRALRAKNRHAPRDARGPGNPDRKPEMSSGKDVPSFGLRDLGPGRGREQSPPGRGPNKAN